jgi:hypothetical protein
MATILPGLLQVTHFIKYLSPLSLPILSSSSSSPGLVLAEALVDWKEKNGDIDNNNSFKSPFVMWHSENYGQGNDFPIRIKFLAHQCIISFILRI